MPIANADIAAGLPPERVRRTVAFLGSRNLWHVVSRNSPATSCRDAASRRSRLGSTGIPLFDELKSLCVVLYRGGERVPALLHCRATDRFDLESARAILGGNRPLARMSSNELWEMSGTAYGTVNPFSEADQFIQVFDADLFGRYAPPYTMMTNAGDDTWAVEFFPAELIQALREVTEVHVTKINSNQRTAKAVPVIGIMTGNGPESGIALWRHVNRAVHAQLSRSGHMYGDLSYPKVLIHSVPEMGLSMELEQRCEQVWDIVRKTVGDLCDVGATHVAVACNTTQWYADRLVEECARRGTEFVPILDVVLDYIEGGRLGNITIIGIPVVASLGEYSAYAGLKAIGVRAVDERAQPYLQELGYIVKKLGVGEKDSRALNKLRVALKMGVDTESVLIALTEISVLLERFPKLKGHIEGKNIIDPLRLYGERLAEIFLSALPKVQEADEADSWTPIAPDRK